MDPGGRVGLAIVTCPKVLVHYTRGIGISSNSDRFLQGLACTMWMILAGACRCRQRCVKQSATRSSSTSAARHYLNAILAPRGSCSGGHSGRSRTAAICPHDRLHRCRRRYCTSGATRCSFLNGWVKAARRPASRALAPRGFRPRLKPATSIIDPARHIPPAEAPAAAGQC